MESADENTYSVEGSFVSGGITTMLLIALLVTILFCICSGVFSCLFSASQSCSQHPICVSIIYVLNVLTCGMKCSPCCMPDSEAVELDVEIPIRSGKEGAYQAISNRITEEGSQISSASRRDGLALGIFAVAIIFVIAMSVPGILLAISPFENDDLQATYYFATLEMLANVILFMSTLSMFGALVVFYCVDCGLLGGQLWVCGLFLVILAFLLFADGNAFAAIFTATGAVYCYFTWGTMRERFSLPKALLSVATKPIRQQFTSILFAFFVAIAIEVIWLFLSTAAVYNCVINNYSYAVIALIMLVTIWGLRVLKCTVQAIVGNIVGFWWFHPKNHQKVSEVTKKVLSISFGSLCISGLFSLVGYIETGVDMCTSAYSYLAALICDRPYHHSNIRESMYGGIVQPFVSVYIALHGKSFNDSSQELQTLLLSKNWAGDFWNRSLAHIFFVTGVTMFFYGYNIAYVSFLAVAPPSIQPSHSASISFSTAMTNVCMISFLVAFFSNSVCSVATGAVEAAAAAIVISAADFRSYGRVQNVSIIHEALETERSWYEQERDPAAGMFDHRIFGSANFVAAMEPEPSAPPIELSQPQNDPPFPSAHLRR